jgi:hypothetical protein
MKSGLQAREGLHLNAYLIYPRDPGNGRSAHFNLSTIPQKAAHHGKCTLGAEQLGARKKGV